MKIKFDKSYAIVGTNICDINNKEMKQMCEMKERITQVLKSHADEKLKNEYLTDDELKMLHAILYVFTKEYSTTQNSAFDDALKELNTPPTSSVEQPQQQETKQSLSDPYHEDQTFG